MYEHTFAHKSMKICTCMYICIYVYILTTFSLMFPTNFAMDVTAHQYIYTYCTLSNNGITPHPTETLWDLMAIGVRQVTSLV